MGVELLFASVGLIILVGFVGNYFFKKTMIPDILWLIILGFLLGHVFNITDPSFYIEYAPFFASIAVMIILFQGGLQTNIYALIKQSPRSLLLAVMNISLSMVASAAFMYHFLGWSVINGLLLGAILGGSSSPIIISLMDKLPLKDDIKTILNIESTLTDALCIISALVIVQVMVLGSYSTADVANNILSNFSIGAVMGAMAGIIWIGSLSKIRGKDFEYMLILSILLLLYSFVESIDGSGAIAAFVFGVVLGNSKEIAKMLKLGKKNSMHREVGRFHREVSFLVKTFFFLYLGLIVNFDSSSTILLGGGLTVLLLIMRFVTVAVSTFKAGVLADEKMVMGILIPRGLAAAVLTQLPLMYGLSYAHLYTNITASVIFMSIILTSISMALVKKKIKTLKSKKRK